MVVDPDWFTNALPMVLADLRFSNLSFIQDGLGYGAEYPSFYHIIAETLLRKS